MFVFFLSEFAFRDTWVCHCDDVFGLVHPVSWYKLTKESLVIFCHSWSCVDVSSDCSVEVSYDW